MIEVDGALAALGVALRPGALANDFDLVACGKKGPLVKRTRRDVLLVDTTGDGVADTLLHIWGTTSTS